MSMTWLIMYQRKAIRQDRQADCLYFSVRDGSGVRGTVPQKIHRNVNAPVTLMFRPAGVYRNSSVVVECGKTELCRKKAMIFTPGEMSLITLKPDMLTSLESDTLTVRIERN